MSINPIQSCSPLGPSVPIPEARKRQLEETLDFLRQTERDIRAHMAQGDRQAALTTATQALNRILRQGRVA